ncbi:uncharacterized protein IL334_007006 [Kwoniella shivajii]|uniref:Dilute domain-containing protein n=1 Tax=Kwoniella shivajii TaxID=564305 RepID=A0ABZ1D7H7_9TREE|nr:hypothetical protein IL334_007006 [Kwoniella shivajii]
MTSILPPPLPSFQRPTTFNPHSASASASPNPLHNPQLSHVLVPESPLIDLTMASPDHRGLQVETASISSGRAGSSSALLRSSSHRRSPEPRFLSDPSPSNILQLLEAQELGTSSGDVEEDSERGRQLRMGLILRRALKWGVERCDAELIGWLVELEGKWADILDGQAHSLEDEEGWGPVGIAVQASCGRQDKEECVRVIVGRWGLEVGQRGGRDRTGWTPLHLAALISTPPLISFLLSRGSSPRALTNRGLTPLDLVVGLPGREDVALFLEHATCYSESSSTPKTATAIIPHFPPARQAMLERRRRRATLKMEAIEREERRNRLELERETWLRERARMVDVDPELLIKPIPTKRESKAASDDSGLGWMGYELDLEAERQDDYEDSSEIGDDDFDISKLDLNSNMLVFSLSQLPVIFDIVITDYTPVCQPVQKRALPANALYLYARFAQYKCDETWLEELIEGIVERIEQGVYSNVENLAYLAFWAYNSSVLLHLLRSDPGLNAACEELNLLGMIEELINAIHVFVIRIAERRIDVYLDAAILDYETLEDFNDIRFEGEWSIFRSFAPKKKRETPRAASIFAPSPGPGQARNVQDSPAASSVYGTPQRTPARHQSMSDLRLGAGTPRSISHDSNISGTSGHSHTNTPAAMEIEMNPSRITEIFSGVLLILQLYEVNPAIVVQAFSQIFFWISCELFNRILAQKRYLCRTKALQIKMNITLLDDWVRANGLPSQTATKHLEPVTQLLQWLQCLSQIKDFDTLIGTMQNMRAINPLQMRRAIRDYKYEVNEGRMDEECSQYLAQLQKDWEKRRVHFSLEESSKRRKSINSLSDQGSFIDQNTTAISDISSKQMQTRIDDSTPIDCLFDSTIALGDFVPQSAPECLGELLDSRYMLPFLLPNDNVYLIASPPKDVVYRNLLLTPASPFISDNINDNSNNNNNNSRPPSRSSFSSSRPMGWTLPKQSKLRELPIDFFDWFKIKETNYKLNRDALDFKQKRMLQNSTLDEEDPLGTSQKQGSGSGSGSGLVPTRKSNRDKSPTPTPTKPILHGLLPPLTTEDDVMKTPINGLPPKSYQNYNRDPNGLTDEGLPSSKLRSSKSIQELRESSKLISSPTFESVDNTNNNHNGNQSSYHSRSESYELKARIQRNSTGSNSQYITPFESIKSPTLSQGSNGSTGSGSRDGNETGGKKKWWKLGKKLSTLNLKEEFQSRRNIREGSEDTIGPGHGHGHDHGTGWYSEEMKTPVKSPGITTPGSGSEKRNFWS